MAGPVVLGLIAGGTALSIFSEFEASKQEAAAYRSQADALRLQAQESITRAELNIGKMGVQAKRMQAESIAMGFASGVDPFSGTGLVKLKAIARDYAIALNDERREAEFNRKQLLTEASLKERTATNIKKTAPLRGLAQGLGGAGKALSLG